MGEEELGKGGGKLGNCSLQSLGHVCQSHGERLQKIQVEVKFECSGGRGCKSESMKVKV